MRQNSGYLTAGVIVILVLIALGTFGYYVMDRPERGQSVSAPQDATPNRTSGQSQQLPPNARPTTPAPSAGSAPGATGNEPPARGPSPGSR